MPTRENDDHLASLQTELRTTMTELNRLHHPVYPADVEQVARLEAQVAELKQAIKDRRAALA